MTKTEIAKTVVKTVVASSVGFVVSTSISAVCPVTTKTQKVKLFVGAYTISAMVSDKATDYIEDRINNIVTAIKSMKSEVTE